MQDLAIAIVAFVSICAWRNFKATVLIWMVAQTLINAQISVRYAPPAMSCVLATDIAILAIYYIKYRHNRKVAFWRDKFLFHTPLMLLVGSYVLSALFSPILTMKGINTAIKYLVANFGMLYVFQKCLLNESDIKLFMKAAVFVALMQMTLGIYQAVFLDNPWLNIVYWNSPHDETTIGRMYYTPGFISLRHGFLRCLSFFGIHIQYGLYCVIFFYLMTYCWNNGWKIIKSKVLIICSILLLIGVFISNSKTGYVGLVVILFSLYKPPQLLNIRIIMPVLLIIVCITIYFPEYLNNYLSLFDKTLAKEDGGSTVDVRIYQFQIAKEMFLMRPIFGNGLGSIGVLKSTELGFGDILGAESSWMQIMPERGIVGAIAYIGTYWSIYRTFCHMIGKRIVFFFLLSILTMETATGIYDFGMSMWGAVLLVIYRQNWIIATKKTVNVIQQSTDK